MKRLLAEPLLHFLLIGALIFTGYSLVSANAGGEGESIVVSAHRIELLSASFTRAWRRPPTPAELEGLIQDYLREEIAVREARALGIDRNDSVIRRLLRQKLEFVAEDLVARMEPDEAELRAWLQAHPDDFRTPPQFDFLQIYFDPLRRGDGLARDAARLSARLNDGRENANPVDLGDVTSLEHRYTALSPGEIAGLFGDTFATQLAAQEPGRWSGPLESAYGVHLVYISGKRPGSLPAFSRVSEAVRREWLNAQRQAALDSFYAGLLQRYRVSVQRPEQPPGNDSDQLAEWRP